MEIKIKDISEVGNAAKTFLESFDKEKVFAFYGAMGAGKTTLIKAICEQLGVKETVSSPTFAIINEYKSGDGSSIYHFDFYRVNKLEEVYDLGYEDYLYSGNLCFIEWPELIEPLLPEDTVKISIEEKADGMREIKRFDE
ncbi:MAG: tRNA (adenosine(37)-N6)-threonylcarbamoyltransferase complex ATPase subunit type 1 TsaE [Fermentimonas sp.]|jgi:tRNA threonylcarbamoyladenosine biosynthesis protein TsaE